MLFVLEQQYARLLRLALRTEQHTCAAFELMTSKQAGSIGGEMVKKMIMKQEEQMK